MGWFKTGYEASNKAFQEGGGYGAGGQGRRFWLPPEGTAKVIFLDDDVHSWWEHNFQLNGSWKNWHPCLKKNGMHASCPLCDRLKKGFPYFVGFHTVINLTPWESKKSTKKGCFGRELFAAKVGGPDKPGMLKRLERAKKKLEEKGGSLRGAVFELTRLGKKSETVGDEITFVEQVPPDQIVAWGKQQIDAWLRESGNREDSIESIMKKNPWEPLDYEKIISVKSYEELSDMLRGVSDSDSGSDTGGDDDIPY